MPTWWERWSTWPAARRGSPSRPDWRPSLPDDGGLFQQAAQDGQAVAEAYEACDFARAMRLILAASERANKFIEQNAPWNLRGLDQTKRLQEVCTIGLNLFRQLAVYLAPRAAAAGRADRQTAR